MWGKINHAIYTISESLQVTIFIESTLQDVFVYKAEAVTYFFLA